jgi:hypothetical protein
VLVRSGGRRREERGGEGGQRDERAMDAMHDSRAP